MNKPLAIGLIIFFILVIGAGAVWLAFRPAEETQEQERGFLQRFPFGIFGDKEEPASQTTEEKEEEIREGRITLLSDNPVASFTVIDDVEFGSKVRWIESQTGHVFESDPKAKNTVRISNTTIPRVFDADWSDDGRRAILKYTEEGNTRVVSAEFTATSTRGLLLPSGILDTAYSPDENRILYLIPASTGARLIAADPDNTRQSEIITSPFRGWIINWPTPNTISFLSRPSGGAEGFLFRYNVGNGSFEKIIGGVPGLEATWSPDGSQVLFSAFDENSRKPRLSLYDTATEEIIDLNIATLVSKCAFSQTEKEVIYCGIDLGIPAALYPDDRLKREIFTTDTLWKINIESGERNILSDSISLDVGEIQISPDGEFLYVLNLKANESIWSFQLGD